jgi:hypothetical protein
MASVFSRLLHPFRGTPTHGVIKLYGKMTTSTSGTIASSSCDGFTITKTGSETGRYTIQLGSSTDQLKAAELLGCNVTIIGADDAAYTADAGISWFVRDDDVATDGTFEIQFSTDPTTDGTQADAELENGAIILVEITIKNSSVTP